MPLPVSGSALTTNGPRQRAVLFFEQRLFSVFRGAIRVSLSSVTTSYS